MTSLLPPSTTARSRGAASGARSDGRRPLVLLSLLAGASAALGPLLVCLAVGVIGWFVSDAGAHGTPSGGLRIGAIGWLMGHGTGVAVQGVPVTVVPLGLTLVLAWAIWRCAGGLGESVSAHGPDADGISDGERDWTVAAALAVFTAAYVMVAVGTALAVATPDWAPPLPRLLAGTLLLCLVMAGPAIAIGSGRAAIWLPEVPVSLRAIARTVGRIGSGIAAISALWLVLALIRNFNAAASTLSALHADTGDAALYTLATLLLVPNAVIFSGAYLLGPGFAVGTGTLVSPSAVSVGAVPAFPLLAALPDNGAAPTGMLLVLGLPFAVAFVAGLRLHRTYPTGDYYLAALRGCVAGAAAAVVLALITLLAGGAVGPGRMREVAPYTWDVLINALPLLAVGTALGALLGAWRVRRKFGAPE